MSDEIKKDEQVPESKTEVSSEPLPESELEKVAGGIVRQVDMASPILMQHCNDTKVDGAGWLATKIKE
jgi:hypothetical protein